MFWLKKYNIIPQQKRKFFVLFLILILAAITGSMVAIAIAPNNQTYLSMWLIFILFAILLAAPIVISIAFKKIDFFEPIYLWLFLYAFLYMIKPLTTIIKGDTFTYGGEFLNQAIIFAIIGLIFFYLGYYSSIGRNIANYIPIITSEISSKKLMIVAWVFIIIGFLGFNHYVQVSGGWETFWSKPHGTGGQSQRTTAYIWELAELMVVGFILIYEITIHKSIAQKINLRIKDIANLLMASIGGVGIYTIIWGSRTLYSWLIIAMAMIYFLKKGRRPRLRTFTMGVCLLFIVLAFTPIYRGYLHLGSNFSVIMKNINLGQFISNITNRGDEFNVYLAEIALVPNFVPYDNFALYYQVPLYVVPRLIWSDKPTLLNRHWEEFLSKSGLGIGGAESILGDFYAQLGILGIIIGTFFSGVFWKTIYAYFLRAPQNRSVILIYAMLLPNIFSYMGQSAIVGILKWVPYMLPPVILALLISRKKNA